MWLMELMLCLACILIKSHQVRAHYICLTLAEFFFFFQDSVDSLVISCGYQTTHILPVLKGRLDASQCKRCLFISIDQVKLYLNLPASGV